MAVGGNDNKLLVWEACLARKVNRHEDVVAAISKAYATTPVSRASWRELQLLSKGFTGLIQSTYRAWCAARDVLDDEFQQVRRRRPLLRCESTRGGDMADEVDERTRRARLRAATAVQARSAAAVEEACRSCVRIVDSILERWTGSLSAEEELAYLKIRTDRMHDQLGVAPVERRQALLEATESAYREAYRRARDSLQTFHTVRLGLAYKLAVLCWDQLGRRQEALSISHTAFDEAIGDLDSLCEEYYKKVCVILQAMRDNIVKWRDLEDPPVWEMKDDESFAATE